MHNCADIGKLMVDYLYGEIDKVQEDMITLHITSCPDCAREFAMLQQAQKALGYVRDVTVPQQFSDRVFKDLAVKKEGTIPSVRKVWWLRVASALATAAVALIAFIMLFHTPYFPIPQALGEIEVIKQSFALTVYNQDLALVRDKRLIVNLKKGNNIVRFNEVPVKIDPTSVFFRSLRDRKAKVLEQNYEYDLVSADKLLTKYIDKDLAAAPLKGDKRQGALMAYDPGQLTLKDQATNEPIILNRNNLRASHSRRYRPAYLPNPRWSGISLPRRKGHTKPRLPI